MESLTPGQQVIKIVNEELTNLMGAEQSKINFSPSGITIIMLIGLQGSGKLLLAENWESFFLKQGKRPLLVAADVYRPAAIKQLQVVGEKLDLPVFSLGQQNPVDISKAALEHAKKHVNDVLLIDTAG